MQRVCVCEMEMWMCMECVHGREGVDVRGVDVCFFLLNPKFFFQNFILNY